MCRATRTTSSTRHLSSIPTSPSPVGGQERVQGPEWELVVAQGLVPELGPELDRELVAGLVMVPAPVPVPASALAPEWERVRAQE